MTCKDKFDPTWRHPDYTPDSWLSFLLSTRADLLAQSRRQVHTRGAMFTKAFERLDKQIAAARAEADRR